MSLGVERSRNASEGRVVETSRMFHAAKAASNRPARSPIRGSGLGGDMDMFGAAKAPPIDDTVDVEVTQAVVISTATARKRERTGAAGRTAAVRQSDGSGLTEDSG